METLNELLSKSASDWSDNDVLQLIEALRTQREQWNLEQSAGTKTRIPSTKIEVKPPKKDLAFEGLKL